MASSLARTSKKLAKANWTDIQRASLRCISTKSGPSTAYTAVTHPESPESLPDAVKTDIERAQSSLLNVYARPPLVLARGKGVHVWDTQDRKYLDFTAGVAVNALGHADTDFAQCMAQQASTLSHSSNVFYNPWATSLAELLIKLTREEGGLGFAPASHKATSGSAKVFFSNSGTEANEGALKIARKVGKDRWAAATGRSWDDPECSKYRIACFEHGFHGRSLGSLSATSNKKYQAPFAPLIPGFDVGKVNDLDGLASLITEDTCAVIVEPIQGEGGVFEVDRNWLIALRKRCNEVGAVLIYDEIQCGLYRTGSLWAHSELPVGGHPDIITMAKPLANGFPIGAVMMREEIANSMSPGLHGTTFGGSPLACALGHHVLSRLSAPSFVASVRRTGEHLRERLEPLPGWFPKIVSGTGIRGRGLMVGIPFVPEQAAKAPGELVRRARERGVLLLTAGSDAVRLVPSLIIGQEEANKACDVIESVLSQMHSEL